MKGQILGGAGLFPALFLLFLLLKLTNVITWSWWWVTAPIWGPIALSLAIWFSVIGVVGSFLVLAAILSK